MDKAIALLYVAARGDWSRLRPGGLAGRLLRLGVQPIFACHCRSAVFDNDGMTRRMPPPAAVRRPCAGRTPVATPLFRRAIREELVLMKATPTNNLFYWATILAACTFGETAADFLSHGPMGLGYVVASLIL